MPKVQAVLCVVRDGEKVANSRWWVVPEDQAKGLAAEMESRFGPHTTEGLRDLVSRRNVYLEQSEPDGQEVTPHA